MVNHGYKLSINVIDETNPSTRPSSAGDKRRVSSVEWLSCDGGIDANAS